LKGVGGYEGLFCGYTGLFCGYIGRDRDELDAVCCSDTACGAKSVGLTDFGGFVGLICGYIGLICGSARLFCGCIGLVCGYVGGDSDDTDAVCFHSVGLK